MNNLYYAQTLHKAPYHSLLTTLCAYIGARPLPSKLMIPEKVLISLLGVSMFTLPLRLDREGPAVTCCRVGEKRGLVE